MWIVQLPGSNAIHFKRLFAISEQPHYQPFHLSTFLPTKKPLLRGFFGALPATYFVALALLLAAGFAGFAAGALSLLFFGASSGASSSVVT